MLKFAKGLRVFIVLAVAIAVLNACVPRTYGEPSATWGESQWSEANYF